MATSESTVDVTVRIDKSHAERLDEIIRDLEAQGLGAIEQHARFLIVNGSIASNRIERLRNVAGVASVRRDQTYRTQAPLGH